MSIYQELTTAFTDLEMLQEAIKQAGLDSHIVLCPEHDGVYRYWSTRNKLTHDNAGGGVHGRDATLVIAGGLDTSPSLYCGDTAFIYDGQTGRYKVVLDEAHGNAHLNWTAIQDNYAALMVEKTAAAKGLRCERTKNAQGKIVLRVYPRDTEGPRLVGRQVVGVRR